MVKKIIAGISGLAVLALVYWWGGDAPSMRGWEAKPQTSLVESTKNNESVPKATVLPEPEKEDINESLKEQSDPKKECNPQNKNDSLTAEEKLALAEELASEATYDDEAKKQSISRETVVFLPDDTPPAVDAEDAEVSKNEYTCTLSIRCDTILNNLDWLPMEKHFLVPQDGVIFPEQTVTFCEGESVFDLLSREMKENKIHLEFALTPVYKSTYIEGIANIYEFDCGALSGWMYKVNDWYPNYGSSRYQLKENDKVEWVYTCELGVDVGGYYGANNRTE